MPEAVTSEDVERTITSFTNLDASGDQVAMTKLAQRLGREQPPLLQYAARSRTDHGDTVGEAAVFYGTLVWAMFERAHGKRLPRLTVENLEAADKIVRDALGAIEGVGDKPIHERFSPDLATRQPHVYAKLRELIEEDVREQAMAEETAAIIYTPTQVIVEAFDAAVSGRRPGERLGPVVNTQPKIGRNDPCPCGSGNKYKKCHGAPTQA